MYTDKAYQAAMSAYQSWSDEDCNTSLKKLVKAWARHYQVSVQEAWAELDPFVD